jgi:hypothetical protein
LDYSQQLFLPTVYAESDGDFVSLNNREVIQEQSSKKGIRPTRLDGVPRDMRDSSNDLDRVLPRHAAREFDWGNVPLYADLYTTAIPVVLHHNAWKDGAKERRTRWWHRTWYFPHLRHMLQQRITMGGFVAVGKVSTQDALVTYYATDSDKTSRLAKVFEPGRVEEGFRAVAMDEVCRYPEEQGSEKAWYDEVFRDGGGPFEL